MARWQTVRVFISSTFQDMHAERDHLVKVVFPRLRERLERHRLHLVDIDNTLKLWDLESGRCIHTLEGHTQEVTVVAVTPDGRQAVSGSDDTTLRVWDLGTGRELAAFTADAEITCCAVAQDGHTIIAGERSGRVHFLRVEEGVGRRPEVRRTKSEG